MKAEIRTDAAPLPIGPYSQGIVCPSGELVFTAGQIALAPGESGLVGKTAREQAARALENVGAILKNAGCGLKDVVRVTIYLRDMKDYGSVNEVYKGYFSEPPYPARSVVEVSGLPKDALVEIEAMAIREAN